MTSPAIETLPTNNSGRENIDTGFPFDSDDSHFRSELEDIAHRHPEFAEHLNPAQRRANSDRFRSQDPFADYRSSAREWPFGGSRFQQFGFPFTSEFDDDPLIQQQQQHQAQANERPPQKQEETVQEKPPQPPQQTEERARRAHIQQSNTVDLGQKQEAVDDNRNQRSMSAPPENRNASNKRFVSSINIPNFNQGAGDNMGGRMSQPETPPQSQQQQQQSNKPTERIIPIHIEGRDEPIIPKNVNISSAGAAPKQPQQPQPQAERIFGQRPSTFTQFLNRGDQNVDVEKQREELARQQQEYQKQQQQEYQQQQQQEYQKHEQSPPPEHKPTPLDLIQNIQKDVSKLMEDVGKFEGKPRDKQYLYLDEMLTRNLLKLDNIETEGKDSIRQARKEAIKCIEQCIGVLESKANANELKLKALEESSQPKEETEVKAPEVEQPVEETPAKTEPMEVEPPKPAQEIPKEEAKVGEEPGEEKTAVEEKKAEPEPSQEDTQEKKKGKKKSESK